SALHSAPRNYPVLFNSVTVASVSAAARRGAYGALRVRLPAPAPSSGSLSRSAEPCPSSDRCTLPAVPVTSQPIGRENHLPLSCAPSIPVSGAGPVSAYEILHSETAPTYATHTPGFLPRAYTLPASSRRSDSYGKTLTCRGSTYRSGRRRVYCYVRARWQSAPPRSTQQLPFTLDIAHLLQGHTGYRMLAIA
ncbi:hypothetical protein FA95DRAFT_1565599, partial [Auriscalpium vulgare]